MEYIVETTGFRLKNSVVTLGKFDGLHIGHQMLIDHILEFKKQGYQSVVFTFSLHPYNLFNEKETKLIYTQEEKILKLREEGLDVLIVYPFTTQTAAMSPEDFIKKVLVEQLDVKKIVVGNDYCFGKDRRGNVQMLIDYSEKYGYEVYAYEKIEYNGKVVSATRIRDAISKGLMEEVTAMLGKPYSVIGEVKHGKKLGRKLEMPTINLEPEGCKLLPPHGVYASKVKVDGKEYVGVTNIGCKPTVSDEASVGVETHLIGYNGNLYGRTLEVKLYHYIREEQKFNSIEELKKQMYKDQEQAIRKFR